MFAALYGTGIRPGDEYFCPSSPAWGHGLWHGTLAPLGLGVTTGTFAGRFDAVRLMKALQDYRITNMRSEEHPSELQSLMRISYAVFGLKEKPTLRPMPRSTYDIACQPTRRDATLATLKHQNQNTQPHFSI